MGNKVNGQTSDAGPRMRGPSTQAQNFYGPTGIGGGKHKQTTG
jgi:hypothetical protein